MWLHQEITNTKAKGARFNEIKDANLSGGSRSAVKELDKLYNRSCAKRETIKHIDIFRT